MDLIGPDPTKGRGSKIWTIRRGCNNLSTTPTRAHESRVRPEISVDLPGPSGLSDAHQMEYPTENKAPKQNRPPQTEFGPEHHRNVF